MGVNEKLGIDIEVSIDDVKDKLTKLGSLLSRTFQADGLAKLVAELNKMEGASAKAEKAVERASKNMKDFGQAAGLAEKEVLALDKAIASDAASTKRAKGYTKLKQETDGVTIATKALASEQAKSDLALASKEARITSLGNKYTELAAKMATYTKNYGKEAVPAADLAKIQGLVSSVGIGTSDATIRRINTQLDDMQSKLRLVNAEANKTGGAFNFLGATMGRMAARLTEFYSIRTVLFTVTGQMQAATSSLLDLGQATHDIAAISGAPLSSIQSMSDGIMEIAKSSRFTTQEVSSLMQVLAQAGVKEKELLGVASSVGLFANATGSKPGVAADLTTTSMNVFGLKADQTTRIVNTLTAGLNESKLEAQGLATAFNYLAPQAAQLGMSLEQTVGFIATMAQAGIKPSTIGTGGSQLFKELSAPKPNGRFKKLLDEKGISEDEISPRLNSFDKIADKFKEKGISAERLFQTLDTRVARSLVTALTLGGDAFRLMTENITGTSAALVANAKAMEGPRARMNVLKQEFTDTIKSISEGGLGKVLSGILSTVTAFVQGLNTTQGAMFGWVAAIAVLAGVAIVSFAAIKTSLIALSLVWAVSPFGWITAAITGLGLLTAAWGYYTNSEKRAAEESNKQYSERAAVLDQYNKLLNKARIEAEANNKEVKEAGELYTKEGKAAFEKNKIFKQTASVSQEIRDEMAKLKKEYPEYLKYLDTELKLNQDLYAVKGKGEKFNLTARTAEVYNSKIATLNAEEDRIANLRAAYDTDSKIMSSGLREPSAQERAMHAIRGASIKKLEEDFATRAAKVEAENAAMIKGMDVSKIGSTKFIMANNIVTDGDGSVIQKPANDKTPGGGSGHAKGMTAAEKENRLLDAENRFKQQQLENKAAISKIKLDEMKAELKEDRDLLAYKEAATAELWVRYGEQLAAAKLQVNRKLADDVNGALNKEGTGIIPGKGFNNADVARLRKEAQPALDTLRSKIDEAILKESADIDNTKLPNEKVKKHPSDRSTYLEKQEAMSFRDELSALNLKKESVKTGAELRDIEVEIIDATTKNAEKTREILEDQRKFIEDKRALGIGKDGGFATEEEYEDAIQANTDRVDGLTHKIRELNAERERKYDKGTWDGYWDSFRAGFDKAAAAMGDFKSLSEDLGGQMFSGIGDVFNTTLSTWTQPKSEETKKLQREINDLKGKKAELEGTIESASAGGVSTPEQATALANLKIQLRDVNAQLREQGDQLDRQTNGWTRFRDALGKLMNDIASTIQRFIVQLTVMYFWQKLTGTAASVSIGSGDTISGFADAKGGITVNTGGLITETGVQRFAAGGQVPLNMGTPGKDSVKALLTPGEIVISEPAVRKYGADYFLAHNAQRFAEGGLVGAAPGAGSKGKGVGPESGEFSLVINNFIDPARIPRTGQAEVLNYIALDALQNGQTYRVLKGKIQGK